MRLAQSAKATRVGKERRSAFASTVLSQEEGRDSVVCFSSSWFSAVMKTRLPFRRIRYFNLPSLILLIYSEKIPGVRRGARLRYQSTCPCGRSTSTATPIGKLFERR